MIWLKPLLFFGSYNIKLNPTLKKSLFPIIFPNPPDHFEIMVVDGNVGVAEEDLKVAKRLGEQR